MSTALVMIPPNAAFLSTLHPSTVSIGPAGAGRSIRGCQGPSNQLCTFHAVISLLLSLQEVQLFSGGGKGLRCHDTMCVLPDPATRGNPGNNQPAKALLNHSTLVAKQPAVFAASQAYLTTHSLHTRDQETSLAVQSYGATPQRAFLRGRPW